MDQVDVIALDAAEKKATESLLALASLYERTPPDDFFWKAVVMFSYPLFKLGGVQEGMTVLSQVPSAYFRGGALKQMEEDPGFAEVATSLVDILINAGKVVPPGVSYDRRRVNVAHEFGRA